MTWGTDVRYFKRTYRTSIEGGFPDRLELLLKKETPLRYGENPNQPAALYRFDGALDLAELTNIHLVKTGKSGLSATNNMDMMRALDILKFFPRPAVAVMKHLIPSGFATEVIREHHYDLAELYRKARDADARSAYGSVVVFNRPVSSDVANELLRTYVEVVAAPNFTDEALMRFERNEDLRLVSFSHLDKLPKFVGDAPGGFYDMRALPTGRALVQTPYLSSITSFNDLILDPLVVKEGKSYVVERDPTVSELQDLLTAWYVTIGVRSNGIVLFKDGVTLVVSSGQQERVGAVEHAITKAYQKALDRKRNFGKPEKEYTWTPGGMSWKEMREELKYNPLQNAVVSSDGFFPFRDSIDLLAEHGVSAVIQPGGSKRDYEVIQAVNKHKMAMVFTLERCFSHF